MNATDKFRDARVVFTYAVSGVRFHFYLVPEMPPGVSFIGYDEKALHKWQETWKWDGAALTIPPPSDDLAASFFAVFDE